MGFDARSLTLLHTKNKGIDQPMHPRSLISAFVIRYMASEVVKLAPCKIFNILASICN